MKKFTFDSLGKTGLVAILGLGVLSLGACSTTSGSMSVGAPISYKVDQGRAFAKMPQRPAVKSEKRAKLPHYRPMTPPATASELRNVDTRLYAHQKVGKTYTIFGKSYTPRHQPRYDETGTASWYGKKFHGKPTATGEIYDMNDITAAHKTLALNSMVLVTNVETGKQLMVRVNDRGPFVGDRIIDLSRAAAQELGMFTSGLAQVRVQYAGPADPASALKKHKPRKLPKARPKFAPKPLPVLPRPQEQAPEAVADLLQSIPKYKPLRDLVPPPAAPTAQPQRQSHLPHTGMPTQPDMPSGKLEDGPITLTIKGPIHMASDKNDGTYPEPRFIPAVNYSKRPATKSE